MTHIFIINPETGDNAIADDLRERLGGIEGLRYFIFVTHHKGYEFQLVKRIKHFFEGEQLRIYCCGGSGTMRNILSAYGDVSDAEFAFFPCGATNAFLNTTGVPVSQFRNIEALIGGKTVDIDYIRTNHGIALNAVTAGLGADFSRELEKFEYIGASDGIAFIPAAFRTVYMTASHRYDITLDDKQFTRASAQVVFSNGRTLGEMKNISGEVDICDGRASYLIGGEKRPFIVLAGNTLMKSHIPDQGADKANAPVFNRFILKKSLDFVGAKSECGSAKRLRLRRSDGGTFSATFDGELYPEITEVEAEIVQRGLHFVLPAPQDGGVQI